ncbi:RNA polymerase sigma factor [Kribbella turkmenica]|uniref:RNA polymerase sigma factor n=2 Tax=Kribbella turkmenica TaxID=2530375 RepID=A0A4R4WP17_9ACTN|nr:RNA polymerase sigma factor [Kribbella turkmenica]
MFGDLDLAEDAVQDAFAVALRRWPDDGLPPNPGAWITATARNRAIDKVRRDARGNELLRTVAMEHREGDTMPDDRLRLIFTCCHPSLAPQSQVELTLRLVCGLSTAEVARAFLTTEPTMAKRLVRTKHKIKAANIPYRTPSDTELPDRLRSVLTAVYLTYTTGHGQAGSFPDLTEEGIRLGRTLRLLMPDEPEVAGLLALMLLTQARRRGRTDAHGELVLLRDQDRSLWDPELIHEGHRMVRWCLRRNEPGRFQLEAAIAAVHADASTFQDTDWGQIVALYDQLLTVAPTPVVALNRAVAVAEVHGADEGLAELDRLALTRYYAFHAARAELLDRVGSAEDAQHAFRTAVALAPDGPERRYLTRRLAQVTSSARPPSARPNRRAGA